MDLIRDQFLNTKSFGEVLSSIDKNSPLYIHGLSSNTNPHFIYSLFKSTEKPILVICENTKKAVEFYNSLSSTDIDCEIFPENEVSFYNLKKLETSIFSQRMRVLDKLLKKENFIIITTPLATERRLTKVSFLKKNKWIINSSSEIDIEDIVEKFVNLNYEKVNLVEDVGQFSVRGSILDFWSTGYDYPTRIELFDTEVDSIRFFDKDSQRSIKKIDEIEIFPSVEFLLNEKIVKKIVDKISTDIRRREEHPEFGVDNQKLIDKFNQIISYLKENMYISNMDLISSYIPKNEFSIISDYLSDDTIIFSEDISRIYDTYSTNQRLYLEDVTYQIENAEVFSSHEKILIPFEDILISFKKFRIINQDEIFKRTRIFQPKKIIEMKSLEEENFNKNVIDFSKKISEYSNSFEKSIIFSGEKNEWESISKLLNEEGIYPVISENLNIDYKKSNVFIIKKSYSKGYFFPEASLHVFTESEIYGRKKHRLFSKNTKKPKSSDIINYSDLEIGDIVVHEKNGIGRYIGIDKIDVNNSSKDYLVIEYRGKDKLYIPIDQMNLIHKYIGSSNSVPKLSSLGGIDWKKAKARAIKNVNEIADDLVELYAKRSKEKGFAFSKDGFWQKELENSFPYEETPSQLRSLLEIKKDMESEKPMDRLLCGDVGYGKTEVALRCAFKAVLDGKQVAFLVPTTILAKQHYDTFKNRLKDFPVDVEMLSRFKNASQQKKILQDVKIGKCDILIGTHRILSKDLKFKDLGFLIIDEEQRFGVKHKEKLKKLKENIDVLTLSATPIPRTLQMSLVGIRDMSTLDEPPEERIATNTYVIEYDSSIIKNCIEKEINRNGQVYFVYNRIGDIDKMYEKIKYLVPKAEIAIAHGRMSSNELEKIMMDFSSGNIDVLLSTTIIETGMDIQNVNTMIVYDADKMGLSQLYQLKGRIGRSNRSSYAYFTYEKGKIISEIGEKRLKAIKDFSDFGSGYKIAMRDLELRGAGNILGESQSGNANEIGYDLYVKYLQDAISEHKGMEKFNNYEKNDVYIDIKVDSFIPSNYIEDNSQKIEMYNRIAKISNMEEYNIIVEDLIDRYGDIPKSVDNILYISMIKSIASDNDFSEIVEKSGIVYVRYKNRDRFSFEELAKINEDMNGIIQIDLSNNPSFKIESTKTKLVDIFNLLSIIDEIRKGKE